MMFSPSNVLVMILILKNVSYIHYISYPILITTVVFMLLPQKQYNDGLESQKAHKEQIITMIRRDQEQLNTLRVRLINKVDECRRKACAVLQATRQQLSYSPGPARGRMLG